MFAFRPIMSASGPGAELRSSVAVGLLLTRSGHRWYAGRRPRGRSRATIFTAVGVLPIAAENTELDPPESGCVRRPMDQAAGQPVKPSCKGASENQFAVRAGPSSVSIARSTCRNTPITSPTGPSSTWRSATSTWAISASAHGARWVASSACASATTGAGRRHIGCWRSRGRKSCFSATTRQRTCRGSRSIATSRPSTIICACRRAPIRTVPGWWAWPRRASRKGCDLIGGSIIAAPSGEIVAQAATKGDELIAARCDLDLYVRAQDAMFNFAVHRRIEHYKIITEQTGVTPPE